MKVPTVRDLQEDVLKNKKTKDHGEEEFDF